MIEINKEKCQGCGLCLPVCPDRNLELEGGLLLVRRDRCLGCGHCQAACPFGAIEVTDSPARLGLATMVERDQWLPFGRPEPAELVQLLRSRRSCRNFLARPVATEILSDLVKIGTTAPSGTNSQGWTFTILPDREQVAALGGLTANFFHRLNKKAANPVWRLAARLFAADRLGNYYRRYFPSVAAGLKAWDEQGEDRLFHGAPAAILVGGKGAASCPAEDALLASQNICLAAHAMGLGSCLIGFVVEAIRRDRALQRRLALGPDEKIYAVIALGYPAEEYHGLTGRRPVTPRILRLD
ncbi:MAG: nitroreductase family protein [Thermodesulfobacteriota bacterium]